MVALPSDFLAAERLLGRSFSDPFDLYQNIIEAARRLEPFDSFYLCRIDPSTGMLRFVYTGDGDLYGPGNEVPLGSGPTSQAALTGLPVVLNDPSARTGYQFNPFGHEETRSGSSVHWPLWIDVSSEAPPDGVISLQSYAAGAFDGENLAAIEWLALRTASLLRTPVLH